MAWGAQRREEGAQGGEVGGRIEIGVQGGEEEVEKEGLGDGEALEESTKSGSTTQTRS